MTVVTPPYGGVNYECQDPTALPCHEFLSEELRYCRVSTAGNVPACS